MPAYEPLKEQDPTQPIDLSHIDYPISERFSSAFSNEIGHQTENMIVNNSPLKVNPNPEYPGSMPTTQQDIDNWKVDRPNLPNIPVGIPKFVSSSVVGMYDNDRNLSQMQEAPPSLIGRFAAFGGSLAASFADLKGDVVGAFSGGVGSVGAKNIAKYGLQKMAASDIFGAKAAQVGSQIISKMGEFGGFNTGYQSNREIAEQQKKTMLQEPHDYLQSLQNIGTAGLDGILLGAPAEGFGLALFGVKGAETADGSFAPRAPEAGEKPATQGGLFNRPEFQAIPDKTKQLVGKVYRPWSKDSNITMTEESAGQMMNGQTVNVDTIMKQGMADAGDDFRTQMKAGGVDVDALNDALSNAQDNIVNEIINEQLAPKQDIPLKDNEKIYYRNYGLLKEAPLSPYPNEENLFNDSEFGKGYWYGESKEQVQKYGNATDELRGAYNMYDVNNGDDSDLNDLYKNVLTEKKNLEGEPYNAPTALLKASVKSLRDSAINKGYHGLTRVEKTEHGDVTGGREFMFFDKPKSPQDIELDRKAKRLNDLSNQYFIAKSIRDHINDTHDRVSPGDMRDYAEQLKSPGIPENDYHLPPDDDKSIDERLNEFNEGDAKTIAESINDPAYSKMLEDSYDRVKKIPIMKQMVDSIKNCLMKGEL